MPTKEKNDEISYWVVKEAVLNKKTQTSQLDAIRIVTQRIQQMSKARINKDYSSARIMEKIEELAHIAYLLHIGEKSVITNHIDGTIWEFRRVG